VKKLELFSKSDKSGAYSYNPVKEAIDNLSELYRTTFDVESAAKIAALKEKAQSIGLTAEEANSLARTYGTEFGEKAFSKANGQPLTSVNAQAFENVRKAVKEAARSMLPKGSPVEAIDSAVSDILSLKKDTELVGQKVNSLFNRINERNMLEKLGRGTAGFLNAVTGGGLKSFAQYFLSSNDGNKAFNSLQVQERLAKNLKLLSGIENAPDEKLVEMAEKLFREVVPATARALGSWSAK
jgi:hypothetical protein